LNVKRFTPSELSYLTGMAQECFAPSDFDNEVEECLKQRMHAEAPEFRLFDQPGPFKLISDPIPLADYADIVISEEVLHT